MDIEIKWLGSSIACDYGDAWDKLTNIDIMVRAATAYFVERDEWRSFKNEEVGSLSQVVADADTIITFNGKLWDIPILGQFASSDAARERLQSLCQKNTSDRHYDIYQIATEIGGTLSIKRYELALLNFGPQAMVDWRHQSECYHQRLVKEGWENDAAFQASKAWEDAGTTYAMWRLWRENRLRTSSA